MNLSKLQKQNIVTKIRESKTFKKASTSNALLQYLHEATLKGNNLKEGVIDIEFFGSKKSTEKNNPRVRVNVYNLRKKIAHYYENEGLEEIWRLAIDKGQYEVRFYKKAKEISFLKKLNWITYIPYLLLIVSFTYILFLHKSPSPPPIWETHLSSKQTTNLFIGDHFGVTGKTATQGYGWTRDFEINSIHEFYKLLEQKPELKNKLKPANYTYTTRMAALATKEFQLLFQKYNQKLPIRFSTRSSTTQIKEGNAIYAGPIKNNNLFIHFFNEANPYLKLHKNKLTLSKHPHLRDSIFNLKTNIVNKEYAIVSKYPSLGNKHHFVFFSEHDIGVSATAEYFTNLDSLEYFNKTYLKNKEHFTAIFEVKGQNRTNTDLKLKMVIPF